MFEIAQGIKVYYENKKEIRNIVFSLITHIGTMMQER